MTGLEGTALQKELYKSDYDGLYVFCHSGRKRSFYPIDFDECLPMVIQLGLAGMGSITRQMRKAEFFLDWTDRGGFVHKNDIFIFAKVSKGKFMKFNL